MNYRKLRIAFSAVCGVLCLLLVVLWIHSYWYQDMLVGWVSSSASVYSQSWNGWIKLAYSWFDINVEDMSRHPSTGAYFQYVARPHPNLAPGAGWSSYLVRNPANFAVGVLLPFWFIVVLTAAASAAPWLRWRFSLRTLLIATTVVAVGLGLIFALSQQ